MQRVKLVNVSQLFARFGQMLRQRDRCEQIAIADPGMDRLGNLALILRQYCLGTTGRDLANPAQSSQEPRQHGRYIAAVPGMSKTPISVMFERFADWLDKPVEFSKIRMFDQGLKGLGKLAGCVRQYALDNVGVDLMPGAAKDGDKIIDGLSLGGDGSRDLIVR